MKSMSYQYLIGATTVSNIINETCNVIWTCMLEEVLPSTLSERDWLHTAHKFEEKWNFPHYRGAIDGKHVVIEVKSVNVLLLVLYIFLDNNNYL